MSQISRINPLNQHFVSLEFGIWKNAEIGFWVFLWYRKWYLILRPRKSQKHECHRYPVLRGATGEISVILVKTRFFILLHTEPVSLNFRFRSMTFMFLRFSRPQIRYRLRNFTNTFFIQIPKKQFLHFPKFEFQEAQMVNSKGLKRGICDIHVLEIFSAAK